MLLRQPQKAPPGKNTDLCMGVFLEVFLGVLHVRVLNPNLVEVSHTFGLNWGSLNGVEWV